MPPYNLNIILDDHQSVFYTLINSNNDLKEGKMVAFSYMLLVILRMKTSLIREIEQLKNKK